MSTVHVYSHFTSYVITRLSFFVSVDCIWNYMGCARRGEKADEECKAEFNTCSMLAMGMMPADNSTQVVTTTPRYDSHGMNFSRRHDLKGVPVEIAPENGNYIPYKYVRFIY